MLSGRGGGGNNGCGYGAMTVLLVESKASKTLHLAGASCEASVAKVKEGHAGHGPV